MNWEIGIDIYALLMCILCSAVSDSVTPWTVAPQVSLSMGFSSQGYWSRMLHPPPGHLPNCGIEPASPVSPVLWTDSLPTEPPGKPIQY